MWMRLTVAGINHQLADRGYDTEVWRGGKAKSRSVLALPETERLKMGALVL